jgi:YfiH family protein
VIESAPPAANPALAAAAFEAVQELADLGIRALVTTRAAGDFNLGGTSEAGSVMRRWESLRATLGAGGPGSRFATSAQVHGTRIIRHGQNWEGWVRVDAADGHLSTVRGTGLGVTIADCVPIFLAHPSGAVALLHAGWRGTAAGILRAGVAVFRAEGLAAPDVRVHLGPAICGRCYEVGPDVYAKLTNRESPGPKTVDLRELLVSEARAAGVIAVSASSRCTRCHNDAFFSHRAGDSGRQVAAIMAPS